MASGLGRSNRALDGRAHWQHLANTVERLCMAAVNGSATKRGDAACFQITLGNLVITDSDGVTTVSFTFVALNISS